MARIYPLDDTGGAQDGLLRETTALGMISGGRALELASRLARRSKPGPGQPAARPTGSHTSRRHQSQARPAFGGYVLGEQLGRGGMAVVHLGRAVDGREPRRVAIKLLSLRGIRNDENRRRFMLELCAGLEAESPNVVSLYGSGYAGVRPYLVMELMELGDLDLELRQRGPLPAAEVLALTVAACRGAQDIADAGLVHRDIKPNNLFRHREHVIKIGDLGLVKRRFHDDHLSTDGRTVGTPQYMSPEQVAGERPEVSWDVYSLGVTMYHLLSGRLPFSGSTAAITMSQILNGRHQPLRAVAPQVDRHLSRVVESAMAHDPDRRYDCPAALGEDCERLLQGRAPRSRLWSFPWLRSLARSA